MILIAALFTALAVLSLIMFKKVNAQQGGLNDRPHHGGRRLWLDVHLCLNCPFKVPTVVNHLLFLFRSMRRTEPPAPVSREPSRSSPRVSCPTRRSRQPLLTPPPGPHREPSRSRSDWSRELAHPSVQPSPLPPPPSSLLIQRPLSRLACLNTRRVPQPSDDQTQVVHVRAPSSLRWRGTRTEPPSSQTPHLRCTPTTQPACSTVSALCEFVCVCSTKWMFVCDRFWCSWTDCLNSPGHHRLPACLWFVALITTSCF